MDKLTNWEDTYAGYVIREKRHNGYFIGPDTDRYRVSERNMSTRFTKAEALEYIKNGLFCKEGGEFIIEDAT